MSNSIRLHPVDGVNPKLSFCPKCGQENNELFLVGIYDHIAYCSECGVNVACTANGTQCPNCKTHSLSHNREKMQRSIPGNLCESCANKQKSSKQIECDQVVKEGGVYWKCSTCHSEGALRAESELAKEVRKLSNIEPPNPVGIDFEGKEFCPICYPKE